MPKCAASLTAPPSESCGYKGVATFQRCGMKSLSVICFVLHFLIPANADAQIRSGIFLSESEASEVRGALGRYPLLDATVAEAREQMEAAFARGVEVPQPGEAGGYAHERHKQNYRDMFTGGLLYAITGEERYAAFVRDLMAAYAELYPTLGPHPLAHHHVPGKLFHQMLNENVFLVHTSIAYDTVYGFLTESERVHFETNLFRPMLEWLAREENRPVFDQIHNHGTWTVAAAGMTGYVLGDGAVVEKALYGTDLSGDGGFLRQLDLLFSPDGYYMEGPYYIRYAMMPFLFFAEAIERMEPERGIYDYRDEILRKAVRTTVQTAFPNGILPPINDASKTMDVRAPEVILGTDVIYARFHEEDLLGVATLQDRIILNGAGLAVARAHEACSEPPRMTWDSVEFVDGPRGDQGGLGILRTGIGGDQSMLLMKYGVHGGGHGHFDKLHFVFFDQGREIVPDYGFGRWINVEPKWGGRYLPEGHSYAKATIAHNTVVVDQRAQNDFDSEAAEDVSGRRHFFTTVNPDVQAMSARANDSYEGVEMQRTMLLVRDEEFPHPLVIDLFRLVADESHTYDYPIHFTGQPMMTNFEYDRPNELRALGRDHGYQHLWVEGRGSTDAPVQFTWLDGSRYYTLHSAPSPSTEVFFTRIGAEDPNFNLRSEPSIILRRGGSTHLFASVIEPHGYFSESREISRQASPLVENVEVLGHNEVASVVRIDGPSLTWTVVVNNGPPDAGPRQVRVAGNSFTLSGDVTVHKAVRVE